RHPCFVVGVLLHSLPVAIANVEKLRVGNLAFEQLESFAFALNERIKVQECDPENLRGHQTAIADRRSSSANLFCPSARLWCCHSAWRIFRRDRPCPRTFVRR